MKPILVILGFLFFVARLGLIDYVDSLPEPGSDSGVGCIDDCLSPAEEPEARRADLQASPESHQERMVAMTTDYYTDPKRFDVAHPILGETVRHPNTGKPALVTRCITTRFGILANLDGDNMTAWKADGLRPYEERRN